MRLTSGILKAPAIRTTYKYLTIMEPLKIEPPSNYLERGHYVGKRKNKDEKKKIKKNITLTGPTSMARDLYEEAMSLYEEPKKIREIERAWLWYNLAVSPLNEILNITRTTKSKSPNQKTLDLAVEIFDFATYNDQSILKKEGAIYSALNQLGLIKEEEGLEENNSVERKIKTDYNLARLLFTTRPFPEAGRILNEQYLDFPGIEIETLTRKGPKSAYKYEPTKEVALSAKLFGSYGDPGKSMGVADDPIAKRSVQWGGSLYRPLRVNPVTSLTKHFHAGTAKGTGESTRSLEFSKIYREITKAKADLFPEIVYKAACARAGLSDEPKTDEDTRKLRIYTWSFGLEELKEYTLKYIDRAEGNNGYSEADIGRAMRSLEEAKPETWKLFYDQICHGQKPSLAEG